MAWKVPINTNITNLSPREEALWCYIILRCQREPKRLNIWAGMQQHTVYLERGQMLLNVSEYARGLGLGLKIVSKTLRSLSDFYEKLHITRHQFGLIIKPINYEEIIKMDNTRHNTRPITVPITGKTSIRKKSDKSVRGGEETPTLTDGENVLQNINLKASNALKKEMGLLEWFDKHNEIEYSLKISELSIRIGKNELTKRFRDLLAQPFHRERFNEIKYVYERLVSYIPN
jgi:hypothetical protein